MISESQIETPACCLTRSLV